VNPEHPSCEGIYGRQGGTGLFLPALPRYLAVIPEEGRKRLRGAIPLCNDCAHDKDVLKLIEEAAESF